MPGYTRSAPARRDLHPLKLVIVGGFGAGKTTLVGAVSEIAPLVTDERMTEASTGTDSLQGVEAKTTTTVGPGFGRLTLTAQGLMLLLFDTPGQERFRFLWEDLSEGALGAVVLADTRRLPDSFAVIDHFLDQQLPFVVAVNQFENTPHRYSPQEIREALELDAEVPVVLCDAREPDSVTDVLLTLLSYALNRARRARPAPGVTA